MYLKLALRNAKRSMIDYLLYIFTMIMLLSILFVSNYIAIVGNVSAGFQTVSLPILILLILLVLVGYINNFMLKQRAQEFANYMLMGMEKKTLIQMFLLEFFFIGFLSFIISIATCFVICFIFSHIISPVFSINSFKLSLFFKSTMYTLFYFIIIELISAYLIKKRMYKLEICEFMIEKERNQCFGNNEKAHFWRIGFGISILSLLFIFCGITFCSEKIILYLISIIAIPLFAVILTSYKCFFQYMSLKRQQQDKRLYHKEYLYLSAKLTSDTNTDIIINSVFCICLLFSFLSFIFGKIMFQSELLIGDWNSQKWMGFLQISICFIFIIIYFSILSLKHVIDIKQQIKEIKILHYMGKDQSQINSLIRKQTFLKLLFPSITCFILLAISIPFINYKLNTLLPMNLKNIWLKSIGEFSLFFLTLYLFYFIIIIFISKKKIENSIAPSLS